MEDGAPYNYREFQFKNKGILKYEQQKLPKGDGRSRKKIRIVRETFNVFSWIDRQPNHSDLNTCRSLNIYIQSYHYKKSFSVVTPGCASYSPDS